MLVNYDIESRRKEKMKSDDRIIHLGRMQGKSALSSSGETDNRLFTGDNKLHALYNDTKGTWRMYYDKGAIPGGLEGDFTTFEGLVAHAKQYFKKRNIEITEIIE